MSLTFAFFLILGFVAVVLLLEGVYIYWNDNKSPEVRRLQQRLRALSAGGHDAGESQLLKERVLSRTPAIQRLLLQLPRVHEIDRLLQQAGYSQTLSHLMATRAILVLGGLLVGLILRWPPPRDDPAGGGPFGVSVLAAGLEAK